jgi:hypothetical protein
MGFLELTACVKEGSKAVWNVGLELVELIGSAYCSAINSRAWSAGEPNDSPDGPT